MASLSDHPDVVELLARYSRWRDIYMRAGVPPWDSPDLDADTLHFRRGHPHPDWYGFAISKDVDERYAVLNVSTEHQNTPTEGVDTTFSSVREAGNYIIYNIGDFLRIECRLDPISWTFRDAGMSPDVEEKVPIDERHAKYRLRNSPDTYFVTGAGGISWTNWLLTLTYDDLDRRLTDGLPTGPSGEG